MESNQSEKRSCQRFKIPGATIHYNEFGFLTFLRKQLGKPHPLIDISRGGLRFLSEEKLEINTKLRMTLSLPAEEEPLQLIGEVKWIFAQPDAISLYQIGVQFYPYGVEKGENNPAHLLKIEEWQKRLSDKEDDDR